MIAICNQIGGNAKQTRAKSAPAIGASFAVMGVDWKPTTIPMTGLDMNAKLIWCACAIVAISVITNGRKMDNNVLILAAGNQDRFGHNSVPKQLLYAGDETIIARICRQVRERDHDPVIITHRPEVVRGTGTLGVVPKKRRWKVESLLAVEKCWGTKSTLVLLGDVIYQGHVMDRIFDGKSDMFYGNYAEIFAYRFVYNKLAREMMTKTLRECEVNGDKGTLHSLFRAYIDGFLYDDIERHKDQSDTFTHVTGDGGWTRDIDSPEDYDRFIRQVIMTNKLDDLGA